MSFHCEDILMTRAVFEVHSLVGRFFIFSSIAAILGAREATIFLTVS